MRGGVGKRVGQGMRAAASRRRPFSPRRGVGFTEFREIGAHSACFWNAASSTAYPKNQQIDVPPPVCGLQTPVLASRGSAVSVSPVLPTSTGGGRWEGGAGGSRFAGGDDPGVEQGGFRGVSRVALLFVWVAGHVCSRGGTASLPTPAFGTLPLPFRLSSLRASGASRKFPPAPTRCGAGFGVGTLKRLSPRRRALPASSRPHPRRLRTGCGRCR